MSNEELPEACTDPGEGSISDIEITQSLRLLDWLLSDPDLYNALSCLLGMGFTPEEYERAYRRHVWMGSQTPMRKR